jgi:hypothetical protein
VGYEVRIPQGNGLVGFPVSPVVDQRFPASRWPVPPAILNSGRNQLSVKLLKRGAGSDFPLQVSRVELSTRSTPPSP